MTREGTDETLRASASAAFAEALVRVGKSRESFVAAQRASEAAAKVVDSNTRSQLLEKIAKVFALLHEYRTARQIAERCQPEDRLQAYAFILMEYTRQRDHDKQRKH